FFFSSRRRHTRSKRDWSSDVCSSDLVAAERLLVGQGTRLRHALQRVDGLRGAEHHVVAVEVPVDAGALAARGVGGLLQQGQAVRSEERRVGRGGGSGGASTGQE